MYALWMAAGVAAFAFTFYRQQKQAIPSVVTALIAFAAGFVSAKIGYVLMQLQSTLFYDGFVSFFDSKASTFSYFFGAAGAFGGIWLSARLFGQPVRRFMNQAAPGIALLVAFLRAGEKALGTIGVGGFVPEGSMFARFPFAVANSYGEHLYAVFYLEALFALLLAAGLLLCRKGRWYDCRAELCAFFLALPQVLCESLRARCLRWGFVRVEQLLCGLLMLGLLVCACLRMKEAMPPARRFWRAGAAVLVMVSIGLLEYALDKTGIPVPVCYLLMMAALAVFGAMELSAIRKR